MAGGVDEREVPSVSDDAPATKGRGLQEALDSMHEAERKTPAYPKLDFAEVPTTFNFTNEETENPRELFAYCFPDSELQAIAEHTNVNADLQYAQEAFKGTPHFHGKHWQPTTASELKIWTGILLYMGVHHSTQPIEAYWNTSDWVPINASLGRFMGSTRWKQIQRYMKVSDPMKEDQYDMQGKDYWCRVDLVYHRVIIMTTQVKGNFRKRIP
jgi:Transposase IS4